MSAAGDQEDPLDPNQPIYYAPRSLRERTGARPAILPERSTEPTVRQASAPAPFETKLANPVPDIRRRPLEPELMNEPPRFARERDPGMSFITIANWVAGAFGACVTLGLLVVIMVPNSFQPDRRDSAFSGITQSIRTVLVQSGQIDAARSAMAGGQDLLAPSIASQALSREQSEELLQDFVRWGQKPGDNR
jgi:hypothetical protein